MTTEPRTESTSPDAGEAPPDLDFTVLGARPVKYAAAPMLTLDLQLSEPAGREVYMIALTIQLMIEPARRRYDDATRERLVELFGAPERWAVTTRSLVWAKLDVLVPAFTGSTTVTVPLACHFDLELAAAKYLHSLPDGEAPLALHFNGMIYYPGEDGGLQMVLIPWSKSIDFRMPVSVWQETIAHYYPGTAWIAVRSQTFEALQQREARARPGDARCLHRDCSKRLAMADRSGASWSIRCCGRATRSTRTPPARPRTPPRPRSGSCTRRSTRPSAPERSTTPGSSAWPTDPAAARPDAVRGRSGTCAPSGERHEAVERRVELGPVPLGRAREHAVRRRAAHAPL